jgi:hypothetical protein
MAALLVEATETGVMLLQLSECRERLGYPARVALIEGCQVQQVDILRPLLQKWRCGSQRFGMPQGLAELADRVDLTLRGRCYCRFRAI